MQDSRAFPLHEAGAGTRISRLGRLWKHLKNVFGSPVPPSDRFETSSAVLDHYIDGFPSLQNAIDAVPGWVGEMPPGSGLVAGNAGLYADTRISWLLNDCYPIVGKSVLELGPLEAFHTYMLHQAGAGEIDAIEANALAFFRCLITKETLKLDRASFFLGDFMKWLEESGKRYDLIVASGVLYHSHDPIRLLELICERTDSFFLWTHYFDEVAMPPGDPRRVPFSERIEKKACRGIDIRLYERSYYKAWQDPAFCGGIQDRHFWIDRADILSLIKAFGFDAIRISDEQPDHINGPSFSVFAQREHSIGRTIEAAGPDLAAPPLPVEVVADEAAAIELTSSSPPAENADALPVSPADPVEAQEKVEAAATRGDVSKPPDSSGEIESEPPVHQGNVPHADPPVPSSPSEETR